MMKHRMKKSLIVMGFVIGTVSLALSQPVLAERYEFKVEHRHLLRNCQGTLIIDGDQIEYQTEHKKDARVWRYEDIKRIEVISPTAINLVTYEDQRKFIGADRTFEFNLLADNITEEVNDFLLSRVKRPLVTSLIPEMAQAPTFEIPVKHRHTFGGCEGVLKIYPDAIVYESRQPDRSRYWRYSDIQQIGRLSPYRFEIATFEGQRGGPDRVFNFELKRQMEDVAYDYVWVRVNRTKYYPYEPEQPAGVSTTANTARVSTNKGGSQ